MANNRLFVGSIPKSKTKEQIVEEFSKVTGKLLSASNVIAIKVICDELYHHLSADVG